MMRTGVKSGRVVVRSFFVLVDIFRLAQWPFGQPFLGSIFQILNPIYFSVIRNQSSLEVSLYRLRLTLIVTA